MLAVDRKMGVMQVVCGFCFFGGGWFFWPTDRRQREDTDATLQREQERGALLGKYRAVWSSGIWKAEAKQSWLEVYSVGLHLV